MKKIVSLVFLIGFCFDTFAQVHSKSFVNKTMQRIPASSVQTVQGIADYINEKFSNQNEKSCAIFIWIAKNIEYDIANMNELYVYDNLTDVADKTLKSKKGICFGYAALFNEIAHKVGIKSYLIFGFSKQKGVVDILPHSWCAALIDSEWSMFDPTWGSGILMNSRFIKQINYYYCKTKPGKNIQSHLPFDPIWQLSYYPISYTTFSENDSQTEFKKSYFNFKDSLSVYENQSDIERLTASNNRIEKTEKKNPLIAKRLEYNREEIIYYKSKYFESQYNLAVELLNNGYNLFNQFTKYYNNKFLPIKSDVEIQQMIDTVETCLNNTRSQIFKINPHDTNASLLIGQMNDSIDKVTLVLYERKAFLKKYLSTSQPSRKYLFYTWKSQ